MFVTTSGFRLSFGDKLTTTSVTLRPTTAFGNEQIYIMLPGSANLTEPNQVRSTTDIPPMSPTLSLEGNQSQQSHQSYQTAPETLLRNLPYNKVSSRQILNIDKALQGDYTAIETRYQIPDIDWEEFHRGGRDLDEISLPLWYNTKFLEAYSGKG